MQDYEHEHSVHAIEQIVVVNHISQLSYLRNSLFFP